MHKQFTFLVVPYLSHSGTVYATHLLNMISLTWIFDFMWVKRMGKEIHLYVQTTHTVRKYLQFESPSGKYEQIRV